MNDRCPRPLGDVRDRRGRKRTFQGEQGDGQKRAGEPEQEIDSHTWIGLKLEGSPGCRQLCGADYVWQACSVIHGMQNSNALAGEDGAEPYESRQYASGRWHGEARGQ